MEQVKAKKERLLDMRTDGEITKEEFLQQRQKLDAELQKLTAEYESLSHSNTVELEQPAWGENSVNPGRNPRSVPAKAKPRSYP